MKKGFTLIEILIVIGVFGILILVATDFLIQVVRNANQAAAKAEIRQNASKIIQGLTSSIRNAACVSWQTGTDGYAVGALGQDDVHLRTYSDQCDGTLVDEYHFFFDHNLPVTYSSNQPAVQGRVAYKVGATGTEQIISAPGAAFISCAEASKCALYNCVNGFQIKNGTPWGSSNTTSALSFDLYVQATVSAVRSDFCAATKFSETVTPRGGLR